MRELAFQLKKNKKNYRTQQKSGGTMCFSSALFAITVFAGCCPPIPLIHHCCSVKPPRALCGYWAFPLKPKRVTGAYWWQDLCYSSGQPRGSRCSKSCSSSVSWHPPALQAVPRGLFLGVPTGFLPCLFAGMPRYCGESP